jgi:hypothetical protein
MRHKPSRRANELPGHQFLENKKPRERTPGPGGKIAMPQRASLEETGGNSEARQRAYLMGRHREAHNTVAPSPLVELILAGCRNVVILLSSRKNMLGG